jgi:hypothetical protein
MYVTPYIAALLSLSSQDSVSEDHPGALSFPGKTVQCRRRKSLAMLGLGTKPDIVIEV